MDWILKGGKAAGRPTSRTADEVRLVINLKAAKQIGLTIPPKMVPWGG